MSVTFDQALGQGEQTTGIKLCKQVSGQQISATVFVLVRRAIAWMLWSYGKVILKQCDWLPLRYYSKLVRRSITITLDQWCSNRGPRSNFHWKENFTFESFKRIF